MRTACVSTCLGNTRRALVKVTHLGSYRSPAGLLFDKPLKVNSKYLIATQFVAVLCAHSLRLEGAFLPGRASQRNNNM